MQSRCAARAGEKQEEEEKRVFAEEPGIGDARAEFQRTPCLCTVELPPP